MARGPVPPYRRNGRSNAPFAVAMARCFSVLCVLCDLRGEGQWLLRRTGPYTEAISSTPLPSGSRQKTAARPERLRV